MTTLIKSSIEDFVHSCIRSLHYLGRFYTFAFQIFYWAVHRPFRIKLLFEQLYFIGNKSVFIVLLTGSFTGMVLCYQTYFGFQVISADTLVGPIVTLSLAKELAPVLTGLIVAGRAGAAMAAQIGTMKVTEQIDALEVMGVNSIQYLAIPRVVASTLVLPLLSVIFLFIGNLSAYIIGTKVLGIEEALYFSKLDVFLYMADIYQGVIKSFVFGFMISSIGCYFGFSVSGGAEGVGKGTNLAVVWGMVTVLVLDFFLTSFLIKIL